MEIKNQKIALLVDGDNAQAKIMDLILKKHPNMEKLPFEGFMATGPPNT